MDLVTTHSVVLDVLHRASSQDPQVLKPAEEKLREWETEPGFYSILYVSILHYLLLVNITIKNNITYVILLFQSVKHLWCLYLWDPSMISNTELAVCFKFNLE